MEGCYERLHFGSQPENKLFLSLTALTLSGKFGSALVMGLWMEDCWDWTARAPWMSSDVEEKIEVLWSFAMFTFWTCEKPGDLSVRVSTARTLLQHQNFVSKSISSQLPLLSWLWDGIPLSVCPQSEDLWSVLQGNLAAMRTRISKVYGIPRLDSKVSLHKA